jgi:integrase/recombinase XerD
MNTANSFNSCLASDLRQYISLKQALGRRFEQASWILLKLDQFLCGLNQPAADLTAETFKQWCHSMESVCSNTRLARMRLVRNFCLYRQRTVPDCFVPDPTQFPRFNSTFRPHIFSDGEVERLLSHSASLPDSARSPLRETATRLAIILLYTTGMRRGELLRLTPRDYDPTAETLLIRTSKFNKSRLLPLPRDVAAEVAQFLRIHRTVGLGAGAPLICGPYREHDRAYSGTQLRKNLRMLFSLAEIKKSNGRLPRIHDFRFSFAVNAILRWYRNGVDVQSKLPFLCAWMGHVSILSTYHYLRFVEPLRSLANRRFADCYSSLVTPLSEQEGGRG